MVRLRFETDLATSIKASTDLKAAIDKVGDSLGTAAGEAKRLELAAKRIVDQNLTPLERYNQKLEAMARAVKADRLSMEEAERTAGRLRARLDETGRSQESFFSKGVTQVAQYAAGFAGLGAVFSALSTAIRQMDADAQRAADNVFNNLGAFGELQQVSTSPADFTQLLGQSRGLVRRGVFQPGQAGQAADLVFALRNAGYSSKDIEFITQLGESRQVKPENLQQVAEGLKKFQDIFGVAEAGDIQNVGKKVFSAAGDTQSTFSAVAAAATLFGSEAKQAGATDEEALAAFVAIEKQSPGVEEAATRLRGVFNQIIQKDLKKGTFGQTLGGLVSRVQGGEASINILGETRAAAGLTILAGAEGQAAFQQQLGRISAAQGGDIIGERRFLDRDPLLRAARLRARAEGREGEAQSSLTTERETLLATVRADTKEFFLSRGDRVGSALAAMMAGMADAFGNEENYLRSAAGSRTISSETREAVTDYLRRIAESNERMEGGTSATPPPGRGRAE